MIRIGCTYCKAVLTVDDAFAGGVCRCQHCGTIQVVPAYLKNSAAAPVSSAAAPVAAPAAATAPAVSTLPPGRLFKSVPSLPKARGIAGASIGEKPTLEERQGNLLKLGIVIAFILFLLLIVLILLFVR
jgi:hypothetical protein